MQTVAPLAGRERLDSVDVVRGVAILGILLVNMEMFFSPIYLELLRPSRVDGAFGGGVESAIVALARGKFYTIFSILFGFGLGIQYARFRSRAQPFAGFWVRRMLVLLSIGLLHGVLIWYGDILVGYALGGLALLRFRDAGTTTLKIWAAILLVVPLLLAAWMTALVALGAASPEAPREALALLLATAQERYPVAGFREILALNLRQWIEVTSWVVFMLPTLVGMFVIGLLFARYRVFHDSVDLVPKIRAALRRLIPLAIVANTAAAYLDGRIDPLVPSGLSFVATVLNSFGNLSGCLTYIFLVLLAYHSPRWHRFVAPLGPVGRMALTHYLTHSIVFTLLANGYGLGLYGRISPPVGLLMTLGMFAIQVVASNAWLLRFRFGPLEWLWRSLSYGRLQPMRR